MSDLISRSDAIKAIQNDIEFEEENAIPYEDSDVGAIYGLKKALRTISALPIAEATGELIRREDVIQAITRNYEQDFVLSNSDGTGLCDIIAALPTADRPTKVIAEIKVDTDEILKRIKQEYEITDRPYGEWIDQHEDGYGWWVGRCDQCGKENKVNNFCPNCGADMRKRKNENTNCDSIDSCVYRSDRDRVSFVGYGVVYIRRHKNRKGDNREDNRKGKQMKYT